MYINVVQHYDETNGIGDSLSESLENLSELERSIKR